MRTERQKELFFQELKEFFSGVKGVRELKELRQMPANCKDEKGELEKTERQIIEDRKTKRQGFIGKRIRTERQKDKI